ncbi:protein phosphatase 2C family protein [archaeon]|nr:MAG: protein phosphatase 2C family protein [archaeon]
MSDDHKPFGDIERKRIEQAGGFVQWNRVSVAFSYQKHTPYTIFHTPSTIHHTSCSIYHTPYTKHHTLFSLTRWMATWPYPEPWGTSHTRPGPTWMPRTRRLPPTPTLPFMIVLLAMMCSSWPVMGCGMSCLVRTPSTR